jgi:hypothetical protein
VKKKYSIHWTREAETTYLEALIFVLEKWTLKEAEHLENLTNDLLKNLAHNLKLCPEVKGMEVRKCVISEQTSLVYRIHKKSLELIAFVDNRSDHFYK